MLTRSASKSTFCPGGILRKVSPLYFEEKNTIRDGGSTELKAAYTVDTVDMVYNVDMVYTVAMFTLLTWLLHGLVKFVKWVAKVVFCSSNSGDILCS